MGSQPEEPAVPDRIRGSGFAAVQQLEQAAVASAAVGSTAETLPDIVVAGNFAGARSTGELAGTAVEVEPGTGTVEAAGTPVGVAGIAGIVENVVGAAGSAAGPVERAAWAGPGFGGAGSSGAIGSGSIGPGFRRAVVPDPEVCIEKNWTVWSRCGGLYSMRDSPHIQTPEALGNWASRLGACWCFFRIWREFS